MEFNGWELDDGLMDVSAAIVLTTECHIIMIIRLNIEDLTILHHMFHMLSMISSMTSNTATRNCLSFLNLQVHTAVDKPINWLRK